jgi:hypothetical protein
VVVLVVVVEAEEVVVEAEQGARTLMVRMRARESGKHRLPTERRVCLCAPVRLCVRAFVRACVHVCVRGGGGGREVVCGGGRRGEDVTATCRRMCVLSHSQSHFLYTS